MTALRVAFAGTPQFAVPALQMLLDSAHSVVGVLTQPDRPRGRGRQLTAGPVKQRALEAGLPLSQPASLRDPVERAALVSWRPDVLVVVAYGILLPAAVLQLPRFGCINIHASLLPRWRGAAPIQRAILAGDTDTGITIMQLDTGLDTGPMLLQRSTHIDAQDTTGSLEVRLASAGAAALLEVLTALGSCSIRPQPQPSDGVTYAAKIGKHETLIDWSADAAQIERQVRAFNPTPGARTLLRAEQLKVWAARQGPARSAGPENAAADPGRVLAVSGDAIVVDCGRGTLELTRVQRAGRNIVSAREFAHGLDLTGQLLG